MSLNTDNSARWKSYLPSSFKSFINSKTATNTAAGLAAISTIGLGIWGMHGLYKYLTRKTTLPTVTVSATLSIDATRRETLGVSIHPHLEPSPTISQSFNNARDSILSGYNGVSDDDLKYHRGGTAQSVAVRIRRAIDQGDYEGLNPKVYDIQVEVQENREAMTRKGS